MKIALVHDYLREYGGAERVVEALHEIWPQAPLYTSFVDWNALGDHAQRFKNWDIRTSWVQRNWFVKTFHSPLRFMARKIWESFDLSEFDVVLTSSGWFICRGVNAGHGIGRHSEKLAFGSKPILHEPLTLSSGIPMQVCYIHHPPRNLYGYATGSDIQKYALIRAYSHLINFFLRHYDYETAQKVDWFVANSQETARRVRKFYRRESTVIYPPVEIAISNKREARSKNQNVSLVASHLSPRNYFLSVGRLSWAKRVDVAIQACNELKLPLKIVGTGKEETRLRELAGPTIEFIGGVTDEQIAQLYYGAKALIFTALDEDFGMVPVEAMACGTPVIALGQGGVLETVIDGKTGLHFQEPTQESLITALTKFNSLKKSWEQACVNQAAKFSKAHFQKQVRGFVEEKFRDFTKRTLATSQTSPRKV